MVGRLAHSFPSVTLASARSASRIESVMMDRAQGGAVSQPERLLEAGGPDLETGGQSAETERQRVGQEHGE